VIAQEHRGVRRAVWALAMLACLTAAVVGWVAWDRSHIHDAAVPGDVLVSSDGRTLTTPVTWTGCEDRPQLEAHESPHAVRLVLKRKRHAFLPKETVCDGWQDRLVTTTLHKPLGSRVLTDAITGSTIAPFEASRLARPRYLPTGYAPADTALLTDNTGSPYERTKTPAWASSYQRNTNAGGDAGAVSILQTTGRTPDVPGTPVSINGHPARLQEEPFRAVTWFDNGYTLSVRSGDRFLTDAEFMKIAEQLRW
jgi:hypothetical protein